MTTYPGLSTFLNKNKYTFFHLCFWLFIKLFLSVCLNYILLCTFIFLLLYVNIQFLLSGPPTDVLICVDLSSLWYSLCAVTCVCPFQTPVCMPNVSVTYFIIDSNQYQTQTRPRQMAALCSLALFV